jgi:hypothetical protein
MKKSSLLFQLKELKTLQESTEAKVDDKTLVLTLIDLLLSYINDADIRGSIDDLPF